ncbi:hypothetical protein Tco_0630394 [Tanacetum coccineum]
MKTPMSFDTKITKYDSESVDSTKYRGMIGLWYPKGTGIESVCLCDYDNAGDYVERKALTPNTLASENACQQELLDENKLLSTTTFTRRSADLCDNKGARLPLDKNRCNILEPFISKFVTTLLVDNVLEGHISIEKVSSIDNIADILTKPLKRESFNNLRLGLGMMEHIP